MPKKFTIEEYQKNSDEVHGEGEYLVLEYEGGEKVAKYKHKCGHVFSIPQAAQHTNNKRKCTECFPSRGKELHQKNSDEVHGKGEYQVLEFTYTKEVAKYKHKCGHVFSIPQAAQHTTSSKKRKCPVCFPSSGIALHQKNSDEVHGKCEYQVLEFTTALEEATYKHKCGHVFSVPCAANHTNKKRKCPVCFLSSGAALHQKNSDEVHGKCEYQVLEFTGIMGECKYKHKCGHVFTIIRAERHTSKKKQGCPECFPQTTGYSRVGCEFVDLCAKALRVSIHHGGNHGEFKIPNTRWRADGYNKRTKTIFEFHGDDCHGNPNKFKPDEMTGFHKQKKKEPAGVLYERTINREKKLVKLGYNVITIWEQDWHNMTTEEITKQVKEIWIKNKTRKPNRARIKP